MTAGAVLTHAYAPYGAARDLFNYRGPEVLLSGPAGTGKSMACLEKILLAALHKPGMAALIVRKTRVSLASSALKTWRRVVAKEALESGQVYFYGGSGEEPAQYRFTNGSSVVIGGMDKPTKIMSTEYDLIYVQEATELTLDDWEALNSRLRHGVLSYQQLLADCNPDRPTHWLKRRADEGALLMLHSTHEDNPRLFTRDGLLTDFGREYIARLDALTGVRKLRLRYGKWVAAEGAVYEAEFDLLRNVVPSFTPPDDWERIWAFDFGFTHPFVWQEWVRDPDGRMYLHREIYRTKRLVEDHARDILDIVLRPVEGQEDHLTEDPLADLHAGRREWAQPQPSILVCDHDAEDRATLERHLGLPTSPAHKSRSDGVQAVASRMRPAEDGKPRLYLMDGALVSRDQAQHDAGLPCSTVEEIPGYVWKVGTDGRPIKDEPVKKDDDGCDTMRYAVAECDLGLGELNVRWLE